MTNPGEYFDEGCYVLLLRWLSAQECEQVWIEIWPDGERRVAFIAKYGSSGSIGLAYALRMAGAHRRNAV